MIFKLRFVTLYLSCPEKIISIFVYSKNFAYIHKRSSMNFGMLYGHVTCSEIMVRAKCTLARVSLADEVYGQNKHG